LQSSYPHGRRTITKKRDATNYRSGREILGGVKECSKVREIKSKLEIKTN
jgi:hypothetical protein